MWLPEMVFVYLRINKNGESQKIKVMKFEIVSKEMLVELKDAFTNFESDYSNEVLMMLENVKVGDIITINK
jgi:hypothetical protein